MNLEEILKAIAIINKLLTIVGDQPLSEVKTWLEVQKNAEELRQEGHEAPAPTPETE